MTEFEHLLKALGWLFLFEHVFLALLVIAMFIHSPEVWLDDPRRKDPRILNWPKGR